MSKDLILGFYFGSTRPAAAGGGPIEVSGNCNGSEALSKLSEPSES